jgi:hypothetical protein
VGDGPAAPRSEPTNNEANQSRVTVVGIDIGKHVFHLVGFDGGGKIVLRREIRRLALTDVFASLPRLRVGMECASARTLIASRWRMGLSRRATWQRTDARQSSFGAQVSQRAAAAVALT